MPKLTQEKLKELLDYNPETGVFTWKINQNKENCNCKGSIAGFENPNGYCQIAIYQAGKYNFYYVHELVWLWVKGIFPKNGIDHINFNTKDNSFFNLRDAHRMANVRYNVINPANFPNIIGVNWKKKNNYWQAGITINRKYKNLGRFFNFEEAVCIRFAVEQCLNFPETTTAAKFVKEKIQKWVGNKVYLNGSLKNTVWKKEIIQYFKAIDLKYSEIDSLSCNFSFYCITSEDINWVAMEEAVQDSYKQKLKTIVVILDKEKIPEQQRKVLISKTIIIKENNGKIFNNLIEAVMELVKDIDSSKIVEEERFHKEWPAYKYVKEYKA